MGDVIRSMVVLSVIVLGLWAFGLLQTSTPDDPVREVDFATTAQSARQAATYPLLAPTELPDGWRANGARFQPGGTQAWHLGVLTADDSYIGLEQEKVPGEDLLNTWAEDASADGTVEITGQTWQRYAGPDGQTVLVQEGAEVTTLVMTSTAPMSDVETFIEALSAG